MSDTNIVNLQRGKIPPQAVDFEEAVIGAMLVDKKASRVFDSLKPEHFYKDAHWKIYEAVLSLSNKKEPIDLLTVSNELKTLGNLESVGGDYYLIKLTQKTASSAHIEYHSRIIIQKAIQRHMIAAANDIIDNCYDETKDIFEMLDESLSAITNASTDIFNGKESKVSEVVPDVIEKGIKIFQGEIEPGIKTPILNMTDKTGGFRDTELIILAARPGMGKTSFGICFAIQAAKDKIPVVMFSLEMSKEVLVSRIISIETGINGRKFNSSGLAPEDVLKIQKTRKEIDELPFYIEDTPSLSIDKLRLKLKKMVVELGIRVAVIDYLQLMSGNGFNREQQISSISRGLKELALELKIPIIAISQLSRSVETRGGSKRPLLSDLRESGAIEQDADMVTFIYRPEYYGEENWDNYGEVSCVGQAEYIVAKNRNGGLTKNRMSFDAQCTRFFDLEDKHDEPNLFNKNEGDDLPF